MYCIKKRKQFGYDRQNWGGIGCKCPNYFRELRDRQHITTINVPPLTFGPSTVPVGILINGDSKTNEQKHLTTWFIASVCRFKSQLY